jgi:hypothetical protein
MRVAGFALIKGACDQVRDDIGARGCGRCGSTHTRPGDLNNTSDRPLPRRRWRTGVALSSGRASMTHWLGLHGPRVGLS